MINNILKWLESDYNSKPCKYCGRQHKVQIELVPSYLKSLCDKADSSIPCGDKTITINLDEGACYGAQIDLTTLVLQKTANLR